MSIEFFPREQFNCYFEKNTNAPLVVSPRVEVDLIEWATQNQQRIALAIKQFGAIVFSGFNLTKDSFAVALKAITGRPPEPYKGDSPRPEVAPNIYKSTAVAPQHTIPPHQEESYQLRKNMPKYISFFCVSPPTPGTGQTVVADVKKITNEVQEMMPEFWKKMSTTTLTYTARYLPSNSWRTTWIKQSWLNPSHATILEQFGTEDREAIKAKCAAQGLICEWDGEWLVVKRKGVPATITVDKEELLCNQIYLDKLSPQLCGNKFKYWCCLALLYPTERSRQFDVKFDDGTEISKEEAGALLDLVKKYEQKRDWKKGDLMVQDNVSTMHGKTIHSGPREIIVAMNGSAV